ncbi:hypothetical protein F5144DRAFT_323759 [Chaetomium tenue]|uniref:Uncharacterized protein n=1 Tax=Chaetomium tenue TaxID=1854479 RepID=A0ACB7P500_9PEZI|nr:hypothetical protein F5144DRAFT_323759 [Chaetomium globosum]
MPQGSKRKYTSYREPSHRMGPQTGATTGRLVVPTAETQELYNKWRQAYEEGLNEESLRQMQNMHAGHLQPPSPSRATSSRSPSNASTTYSVSHAMGEMDVGDQSQTRKQKPGRRGPLNPIKQLRANLMRKIGACPDCRERRVSCNHHVLTLFEQAYQAAKQKTTSPPVNANFLTEPTPPYQTRLGSPADLAGVGGGQNPIGDLPYHHLPDNPPGVMDDGLLDFDLSQNTQFNPRPDLAPILSIFPDSQVPESNPTIQYTLIPGPQGPQPVAIGKQFAPFSQHWVCLGGNYTSGLPHCGQQFPNLPALEQHFAADHARLYGQYHTWGCSGCRYQESCIPATNHRCIQCQKPSQWEMWYWGTVDDPSAPPSVVPGLSISQGESLSGPSSQASHSVQHPNPSTTYNNTYLFSPGGYGYGYGGGQSHMSTPAIPTPTADAKLTCHPCKPLISGMCFSKLCHLKRAGKTIFLRRVCPAVIVLTVSVLALIARGVSPASNHHHFVDGVDPIWDLLRLVMYNGHPSIPQLSAVCIAAGLAGTWLFWHVMDKMMQPSDAQVCSLRPRLVSVLEVLRAVC